MAGSRTAQAERMAQERAAVLVIAHSEVSEAAQRVSTLEGELVAMRRARDTVEEKILSLVAKTAAAERRWVAAEEQCERMVHEQSF